MGQRATSIELVVRDGAGFTFAFEYLVATRTEAVKEFKRRCRRNGITRFKHIKIVESIPHNTAAGW